MLGTIGAPRIAKKSAQAITRHDNFDRNLDAGYAFSNAAESKALKVIIEKDLRDATSTLERNQIHGLSKP